MIKVTAVVLLAMFVGQASCDATDLPYPTMAAVTDKRRIPGGEIIARQSGDLAKQDSVQDESLAVNGHILRGYSNNVAVSETIYIDGKPVIVLRGDFASFDYVKRGDGRTYVELFQSIDEDHPANLWFVDVSSKAVFVTPMISGCASPKQSIVQGADVIRCEGPRGKATIHRFKDGRFQ